MSRISIDLKDANTAFSILDNLAQKELTNLTELFLLEYNRWKPITINKIFDQLDLSVIEDKDKQSIEVVLNLEVLPKLVYDRIYILIEDLRKKLK